MLPIILDHTQTRVVLAGAGEPLERRFRLLTKADLPHLKVFDSADGLPEDGDLDGVHLLFIAGLDPAATQDLVLRARARGILVNAEDQRALCDFHVPSTVRRGDLLLSVSTGGASPALARRIREHLEGEFDETWEARVEELSVERRKWREDGADIKALSDKSNAWIDRKGWLR